MSGHDPETYLPYITIGVVGVVVFVVLGISAWTEGLVKREVIKAGLVQDKHGHWVVRQSQEPEKP